MTIEYLPIAELKAYGTNARKHGDIDKIKESIRLFGFNVPILVDQDNVIICGHGRVLAAEDLGMEKVPAIRATEWTEDQIKQFRIIENKTADLSSWDYDKLLFELSAITEINMDVFEFAKDEEGEETTQQIDSEGEVNIENFGDETFDHECPYCGFKWNE